MENNIFILISITYFNSPTLGARVHYYRTDFKNQTTSTWDKLTPAEANVMMWELIKLGGKNCYTSNPYDNAISTREVQFYGTL